MRAEVSDTVAKVTGKRPERFQPLGGGCIGDVYRVELEGGGTVVAKLGDGGSGLGLEGFMLRYLADHSTLPVPRVLHAEDRLLIMSWIEGGDGVDAGAQAHAAELLAALHGVTAKRFGFERHTLIGGLDQPNPWSERWIPFFRDQRLLYMGGQAQAAGRLPKRLMGRLEALAGRLERWLEEPEHPSLVHGDVWTGNVLCRRGRVAGFVDPAIYYAHPEIELAFSTMFGTFSETFFARYGEIRPLRPGFFEERLDLYNLYPLLVHVRLFGGSYAASVERTLKRFGC
ncbi:MAG: fructosamine kinase family protein [Rhodospirillales bacterium]|jgi:fructosamine-3-kinase|nr:fructosamine kinase family protein [Rhodospirillales bacterium]